MSKSFATSNIGSKAKGPHWGKRIADRLSRSGFSARMHARAFRASRGRLGAAVQGKSILLLSTTGRRTGVAREVVLMHYQEGGRWLVVASNAAEPDRPPQWWLNLQADPRARVMVSGRWHEVVARALSADERDRLWPDLVSYNPHWDCYQAETTRRFPVVALAPIR